MTMHDKNDDDNKLDLYFNQRSSTYKGIATKSALLNHTLFSYIRANLSEH